MANVPIRSLDAVTAAEVATSDELVINDVSDNNNVKKITVGNLLTLADSASGAYSFDVSADGGTPESISNNSTLIVKKADDTIFTQVSSPDTLTIKANTSTIATVAHVASRTVNDLNDTTITSVADNDILAYDSGSSKWINQSAAEAGITPVAGSTSLVTLGTVTTGVWNGTPIATQYGGTGQDFSSSSGSHTGVLVLNNGVASLAKPTGGSITSVFDEDDMASNSAVGLVTQQSVKAFVEAQVSQTFVVTVADDGGGSQNVYVLDGTKIKTNTHVRKVLHFQKGVKYRFDVSHTTNINHPLRLSVTRDGTHNSGTALTDGVEIIGTPGNAGAFINYTPPQDSPDIVYIYCMNHAGMGGTGGSGSEDQRTPIHTTDKEGWFDIGGNRTASKGDRMFLDTSTVAITITLPANPTMGDEVWLVDASGDANSNNITVNPNGAKIEASTGNVTLNTNRVSKRYAFYNATEGWISL